MYKFIRKSDDNPPETIEFTLHDGATLNDMLEKFEDFLLACGYRFRGTLDFQDECEVEFAPEEEKSN